MFKNEESKEVQDEEEAGEIIRLSVKLVGRYVPPLKRKLITLPPVSKRVSVPDHCSSKEDDDDDDDSE